MKLDPCAAEQLAMRYDETPDVLGEIAITKECLLNGGGMFISNELVRAIVDNPNPYEAADIIIPMVLRFAGKKCEPPNNHFAKIVMEMAWKKAVEAAKTFNAKHTPEQSEMRKAKAQKAIGERWGVGKPTREECHEYGKVKGIPYEVTEYFWHMGEAGEWKDKTGEPIRSWKAKLLAAAKAQLHYNNT